MNGWTRTAFEKQSEPHNAKRTTTNSLRDDSLKIHPHFERLTKGSGTIGLPHRSDWEINSALAHVGACNFKPNFRDCVFCPWRTREGFRTNTSRKTGSDVAYPPLK